MTGTGERRDEPRDAGVSLVEVMVAMLLLGILLTVVTAVAVLGMRTSTGLQVRLDNSTQGDRGMAATSKALRTAVLPSQLDDAACTNCTETAIVQATPTRVTFYANLHNEGEGPSLMTLDVVEDPDHPGTAVLRQTRIPPTRHTDGSYSFCSATDPACPVDVRALARGLVWPTAPLFAYYDFDGLPIGSTAVTTDQLPRISSVDVSITVQSAPAGTDVPTATTLQRVRLPNADINLLVDPAA
jgi:prepilin-type N-terminal cleavage/methylation domain-containing protein